MTDYLAQMQGQYPVMVSIIVLMFGLIIGSFLNVVILRLPVMMEREWRHQANEILDLPPEEDEGPFNLVIPNSHCPSCKTEIKPWQNIPVLSYLFLKGQCGNCGTSIPIRYPLVEVLTGILTVVVVASLGLSIPGLLACLLTWSLIALAIIDQDTQLLPDSITLPLLWLGLCVNFFDVFATFEMAFIGTCLGYLSLWIVYQAFKLVTGKEGMGFGDFKLLAMLGAWLGWAVLPLIIVLSSLLGAIIGGAMVLSGRDKSVPFAFGPYLALAGWISLLWGMEIMTWYLEFMA